MTKWRRITPFLQWEVAILILIITSKLLKFRIGEMPNWVNAWLNKRPCWDSIHDTFASENISMNRWTALPLLYHRPSRYISLYNCCVSSTIINLVLFYDPWNKSEGIPTGVVRCILNVEYTYLLLETLLNPSKKRRK